MLSKIIILQLYGSAFWKEQYTLIYPILQIIKSRTDFEIHRCRITFCVHSNQWSRGLSKDARIGTQTLKEKSTIFIFFSLKLFLPGNVKDLCSHQFWKVQHTLIYPTWCVCKIAWFMIQPNWKKQLREWNENINCITPPLFFPTQQKSYRKSPSLELDMESDL